MRFSKLIVLALLLVALPAGATISLVNTTTGAPSGSGNSISATAQNHTGGNLLVVMPSWGNNTVTVSSITDTAGNTYTRVPGASFTASGWQNFDCWYAKNITGNASNGVTATLSANSGARAIIVFQYSGADTSAPLDQSANTSGTGTSLASPNVTTTAANEVLTGFGSTNTGTTWTAGSGYGHLTSPAGFLAMEDQIVSSTGTYNATFTLAASGNWAAAIATWKAAPSAVTPKMPLLGVGPLALGQSAYCSWHWSIGGRQEQQLEAVAASKLA